MTSVKLLNVPFESNYKDTVYFATKQEQEEYMNSKVVEGKIYEDLTYQRKEGKIRIPAHIDTLYNCNYVAYTNKPYTNKTFYAFITDMEYRNDDCTWITIETDVMQTWMFDYSVKQSFVEREHVTNDAIGVNTVPEQVETGEYICDYKTDKKSLLEKCIVLGSTLDIVGWLHNASDDGTVAGVYYNGVYSGVKYYLFTSAGPVNSVLVKLAKAGKSDAVVSLFMAPYYLLEPMIDTLTPTEIDGCYNIQTGTTPVEQEWDFEFREGENDIIPTAPTTIDGYTPKNKKLLTYPYCYLYTSNNAGGGVVYHYEYFEDRKIDFKIYSALTPSMSVRLLPLNYKGVEENNSEGINLGKLPICAWTTDVYTNWLTQNAVNIGINTASNMAQIIGGAVMTATGAGSGMGVGLIASGVMGVANTVGSVYQHSLIPPASNGNINSGDVTYGAGKLTFTLYQMNIRKEYAQIIDEFFDMFGYKVNRVKVPNKDHRSHYWYTKTIDVNIDGAIPNTDLQAIKDCYNRGVTFWRNDPNVVIGNYKVNNVTI